MPASGKVLSDYDLNSFVGRGVLIDASNRLTLDALRQADLKQGDIVLIRTRFSDTFDALGYAEKVPDFPIGAAKYLAEVGYPQSRNFQS